MNEHLGSDLHANQFLSRRREKRDSRPEAGRVVNGDRVLAPRRWLDRINQPACRYFSRIVPVNLTSDPRGCHNERVISAVEGIRAFNDIDGAVDEDQQWVGETLIMVHQRENRTITASDGCCRFINTPLGIRLTQHLSVNERAFNLNWLLNLKLRLHLEYTGVHFHLLKTPLESGSASSIIPDRQTMYKKICNYARWNWDNNFAAPIKLDRPGLTKSAKALL
jgi:hypothetical protein